MDLSKLASAYARAVAAVVPEMAAAGIRYSTVELAGTRAITDAASAAEALDRATAAHYASRAGGTDALCQRTELLAEAAAAIECALEPGTHPDAQSGHAEYAALMLAAILTPDAIPGEDYFTPGCYHRAGGAL